ncbi:MAG TPA: response regulator [Abditibacteriaceae bacterium]|jgi:two-component system phosphate regulon response regulator PhoB
MSHILVVDDDPDINNLISLTLTAEGYDVEQAYAGKDALRMAQAHAPDLILLDMMMPGMSGIEVARALQAIPSTQNTPVVFVTAKGQPEDRAAGFAVSQTVDYICKPFDAEDLARQVSSLLKSAEALRNRKIAGEHLIRQRR